MKPFIDLCSACPVGRAIVDCKVSAWESHRDDLMVEAAAQELQHLAHCPVCNPALATNAMLESLWPGVKVVEA